MRDAEHILPDRELEMLLRYLYEPEAVRAEVEKLLMDQTDLKHVILVLKKEREEHGFADIHAHRSYLLQQQQVWTQSLQELSDPYPLKPLKSRLPRTAWLAIAAAVAILLFAWWLIPTSEGIRKSLYATHIEGNHLDPFEAQTSVRGEDQAEDEAMFKVIRSLYAAEKFKDACAEIAAMLGEGVSGDIWMYRAGFACMKAGEESAADYFEQINSGALYGPALLMKGWVYSEQRDTISAHTAWEEIMKNEDLYPEALVLAARELLKGDKN